MMHTAESPLTAWMATILDQIDYGIVLVDDGAQALFVNRAGRALIDGGRVLRLRGGVLDAARAEDGAGLRAALRKAIRDGLRTLLPLGDPARRSYLSVIPLAAGDAPGHGTALLVAGRHDVGEGLSAQGYARSVGLTSAECQVMRQLCGGAQANEIARRQGVAVSTIRTQIGSIRAKAGVRTVGALMQQLASLPPMTSILPAASPVASLAGAGA